MNAMTRPIPVVTLSQLEKELSGTHARVRGDGNVALVDVTQDSRRIRPGALFVARRGKVVDGTALVPEALDRGAVAVLCERGTVEADCPLLEVDDLSLATALAAHSVHGKPSEALRVVGITGTNGKTTTAFLLEHALTVLGDTPARLGTLGFTIAGRLEEETLTTPQGDDLARFVARARAEGASSFVMEVSSHALEQGRVRGLRFFVGALSNLSQDHLDYHETMEAYAAAKRRLFADYSPQFSVINVDDAFGAEVAAGIPDAITVSRTGGTERPATIACEEITQSRSGLRAKVRVREDSIDFSSKLVGWHNLDNLLLALGCLVALGHEPARAARALESAPGVPGRLERCDGPDDDITVLVDYAHTPDALRRALDAVRDLTDGDLVCVFGCGGDRDRGKRPLMGLAAAGVAQRVVLTSDNPRSEDPESIISDILPGVADASGNVLVEVDRRKAIARSIAEAKPGDLVLVAGKGHETYQLVGDQVLDFDDREEARRALAERRGGRG